MDQSRKVVAGYQAVERMYHAYLTGFILSMVTRRGPEEAAELVFRLFRRQHLEKFLPGIEKLGLSELPDAVACAQYHYLSNKLGGVKVEFIPETDRKSWVRYPPPRWIFEGTAICGVPSEVSRAMLRAWHAHNGVSLGNPRLGFVCTKQTVDGQPGLEGYYREYDRDLAPEERLRFSPDEEAPPFNEADQPKLESDAWPEERLKKVLRNYAMEYVRNIILEAIDMMGPGEGEEIAFLTAKLIGMHFYDESAGILGIEGDSPEAFAEYLTLMTKGQGDEARWTQEEDAVVVRGRGWRLMRGVESLPNEAFGAWNGLWVGTLAAHNRRLRLDARQVGSRDVPQFEWRISSRKP